MTALVDRHQAQREAERVLLARYGPACVLVDDNLDILFFHGETSRFLEDARGPASLNLKKLGPPSLLVELSTAIREVQSHGDSVRKQHFPTDPASVDGENQVEVISVQVPGIEGQYYLILFEDGTQKPVQSRSVGWLSRWRTNRFKQIPAGGRGDVAQLRRELEALQNFLKVTIEEHEAAKEEMKSAHEELLSMNEEYFSTNEELETAKAELQSTNEELAVTNEELRNRNDELNRANRDLRSSRDHSQAIIETMREGLLVLDADFRVMQANHSFYECFDTRAQDTVGHSLFELGNHQWNIPLLHELLEKVLPEKRILRDYEVTHTFPAVGERVMLLNARHLSEEHPGKEMILLAIEDITERLDAVKKADLRKSDFLSMLAHELRNPLTPIRNAAALLAARDADEDNARYHKVIERQVSKLSRLIDDLLDVTRFTRGNIILRKEPIDLLRVVNQAVEAYRLVMEEKQIELSQSLPTTPLIVLADATRLEQAIGNLLENAAKSTDLHGKIELTLEHDGEAVLSIRDNGIGIAPEALTSIFEIFFQAASTLDRSRGGVGLGLSLARRLVEMHNGRIEAFSDGLDKGSEFIIRLPLADQSASTLPLADAGSARLVQVGSPARQVLIVDDNADVADTMRELIVALGHHAATALDGRSALALIPTLKPDLGLIDIGLPDMVGYELARRIRGLPGGDQIFLTALTGYGREEDRKAALEAGFARHLVKPITLRQIEELLATSARSDLSAVARDGGPPPGAAIGDGGPTSAPATSDGAKPADKSTSK